MEYINLRLISGYGIRCCRGVMPVGPTTSYTGVTTEFLLLIGSTKDAQRKGGELQAAFEEDASDLASNRAAIK